MGMVPGLLPILVYLLLVIVYGVGNYDPAKKYLSELCYEMRTLFA